VRNDYLLGRAVVKAKFSLVEEAVALGICSLKVDVPEEVAAKRSAGVVALSCGKGIRQQGALD